MAVASAQAKTFTLNSSTTGHVELLYSLQRDSADWYKVTTSADGRLRLTVTTHNAQAVYAYLYDNDGLTLPKTDIQGTAAVCNKDRLAAGTHYVRILKLLRYRFCAYTLGRHSLFIPAQTNDPEPIIAQRR